MSEYRRSFTLIELLVVIAIILTDAEYIAPYDSRREQIFQLSGHSQLKAAVYRKPDGRMLIAAGNFSGETVIATLNFPEKLPSGLKERRTGEFPRLNGNTASIEIKPYNFVLIGNYFHA